MSWRRVRHQGRGKRSARKGLIERKPKSHRYHATDVGLRVALFYSKLNCRLLRPGWAAIVPTDQIPRKLATAFARVEAEIERCRVRAMGLEAGP